MELCSWNQNREAQLLLQKTYRIQRLRNGAWNQTRPTTRRRNSQSHWSSRYNRLQPVHRDGVRFITDLENKKFLAVLENLVRTSVER